MYSLNNRAPNYVKQKLTDLKGEIQNSTILLGDVYNQLSIMDRMTIRK